MSRKTVKNKDGLKDEKIKNSSRARKKFFKDKVKSKPNKKVRNATPEIFDGIQYKSRLESYMAQKLKEANIDFTYEGERYLLASSFKSLGSMFRAPKVGGELKEMTNNIRTITYTPDFIGDGFIIETKGMSTQVFEMRFKLFRRYLTRNGLVMDLYVPSKRQHCDQVIELILSRRNDRSESSNN